MRKILVLSVLLFLICCITTSTFASSTSANITITVVPAPLGIQLPLFPQATIGVAYTAPAITATGGIGPYTWSATSLPPGLTIDAKTGIISGTPTSTGTFNAVITVTDSNTTIAKAYIVFKNKG